MDAPPGLLTDLYELTMAAAYVAGERSERPATFSLFVRYLPPSWSYLVAAGLDRPRYLEALRFTDENLGFLDDLRRLRAFYEVAERGSFSAAAAELGYAQSVVSHHVAALEAEHGIILVDRTSRPVRLTPAGEVLRSHAVDVLGGVAAAEDALRSLAGARSGTLRIAAFSTACTTFVPAAMARFQAAHPDVDVSLEQREPADALQRVRAGDVDVGVVFTHRPSTKPLDEAFAWSHLGDDPFRLVLPVHHPLARRAKLRIGDLAGERFFVPPREGTGITYNEMLERLCAEGGFRPAVAYTVADVAVARALVAAGLGVAVLGQHTIPKADPGVAVRPLPSVSTPQRAIMAVQLRTRRVPTADRIVPLLVDAAAVHIGTELPPPTHRSG